MAERAFNLAPTKPNWTIRVLTGLLAAALAWSTVGELEVVVYGRGRVITDGQIKTIEAAAPGTIKSIHVKEGDHVRAGDLLVVLDPATSEADLTATQEKLAHAAAELQRLQQELGMSRGSARAQTVRDQDQALIFSSREMLHRQQERELTAALESKRAAIAGTTALLQGLQVRASIAREKEEAARPYVGTAIPRFQYLQLKQELLALEQELESARDALRRLHADAEEASQKLVQVGSARRTRLAEDLAERRSSIVQLEAQVQKARVALADSVIRAPVDGYVQKVAVTTIGAPVASKEVVAQLVPDGASLVMEVFIPNEERGFIRLGQRADIKLDAFPFQKYGRLEGRVEWISPDADAVAANGATLLSPLGRTGLGVASYAFRGKISLPAAKPGIKLGPGLTGQVDIATDRRRIIDFFLFPIQKTYQEALRAG